MRSNRELTLILIFLVLAGFAAMVVGDYWIGVGIGLMAAIALAQSWALMSALSGYVSLGHVVFYGLGAYVVVVTWNSLSVWFSLPLAGLCAAFFALLVGTPVLRAKGPYFVILTFGVSELVKFVLIAIEAAFGHASRLILGAPDPIVLYYMLLVLAAFATLLAFGVRVTKLGYGLRAIRENEQAAENLGVPVAAFKLAGFVISAVVPGMVVGVIALRATYFEPRVVFDPMISFSMIATTIIGGSDDLIGPVLGAMLLTLLSELLWANAPELYMVILGVLLVVFVRFVPQGLVGFVRDRRRLCLS
jgi:branched-chain amino acid transport system permease protein